VGEGGAGALGSIAPPRRPRGYAGPAHVGGAVLLQGPADGRRHRLPAIGPGQCNFIALDEDSDDEMEDAAARLVSLDFSLNFHEFRLNHPKFVKFQ
jgi:hypothetical protein